MTHTLYTIMPSGTINTSMWSGGKSPSLDILQHLVGGYIQIVPGFSSFEVLGEKRRCVVYCDEDGIQKQLRPNPTATKLWVKASPLAARDPDFYMLFGPVVVTVKDR